ncbi:23 kDa jasmonate-induced protein-like [Vicia villosa]|uniref:23 kDa jasmonate-induced protein-like n=1 Tax=Vicia villosa TaxID=3911 RepID=UPI00273C7D87|nr:23 kDa jasmonate-induced protein-like [Vicia villosa]
MANPFGVVVDNDKLEEMARYIGKTITQEDRAREAMHLINEDDKDAKAAKYVDSVKEYYGDGVSTLCLVYNATGDTISYVTDHDWYGYIGRTPYPTEIGNGQWGAFHHVHETGASSGSEAAVVYRGKTANGNYSDFMLAWSTPWGGWYKNKAYCEMGAVDSFPGRWSDIYPKINNSDYHDKVDRDGIKIDVDTAKGTSPVFKAIIKIPFSP